MPSTLQISPTSQTTRTPPDGARPRPPIRGVRRAVTAALRVTLRLFFRTVKVEGDEHLPRDHAYIVVLNHPNGLVDPGLVLVTARAPVSFLAKSTIFEMPVLGWLARTLRAIPVYRRQDAGADVAQNAQTFEAARAVLREGGAIALFPEGISHDARTLLPLKTGAARIALGAARSDDDPLRLSLVPAALLYSDKTRFRSDVVLRYGAPISVPCVAMDGTGAPPRDAVHALNDTIAQQLGALVGGSRLEAAAEFGAAVRCVFADEDAPDVGVDVQARAEAAFEAWLARAPAVAWDAHRRVAAMRRDAEALNITPTHLRLGVPTLRAAAIRVAKLLGYAPLATVGWLLHVVPYRAVDLMSRRIQVRDDGEDLLSTVKVLAAMLFFPLTWIAAAVAVGAAAGFIAGGCALVLAPMLGYAALRFMELLSDTAHHTAVIWSALVRGRRLTRLRAQQVALGEQLRTLEQLHGSVPVENDPPAALPPRN